MQNESNEMAEFEGMTLAPMPGPFADRAGASSTDSANCIGAEIMPDDLPMIVWLRGDEPNFNDFSVDVDGAMAELGIRRSRLTQISGRELRVGKKRVDRYIRPCFRPEDIAAYKTFTRATVSHMKSSQVLDDVLMRLENETGQLIDKVAETVTQNAVDFQDALTTIAAEFRQAQGLLLREVTDRVDSIERGLDGSLQAALQRVQANLAGVEERSAGLESKITAQNETILSLMNQNHLLVRELHAATSTRFESLSQQVAAGLTEQAGRAEAAAAKAAEQIEMTVHQTRLTIRGDLKKLTAGMEAIAESNATQTGAAGFLSESGTRRKRTRTRKIKCKSIDSIY